MTRIEDMSETERESWIVLLADGAVFAYLWQKTTIGLSPKLIHTNMDEFGGIIIGVIIVTVILHSVIAGFFSVRSRDGDHEKDERDIEVERKGAHFGYRLMQWGVGAVIITMFLHHGVGLDYTPPVSMEKPAEIIFALLVISYIADLAKHAVMIHAYRG